MNDLISIHIDSSGGVHVIIDIMCSTAESAEALSDEIRQYGGFFVVGEMSAEGAMIQ